MTCAPRGIDSTKSASSGRNARYPVLAVEKSTEPSGAPIRSSCAIAPRWVWNCLPGSRTTVCSRPLGSVSCTRSPTANAPGTVSCSTVSCGVVTSGQPTEGAGVTLVPCCGAAAPNCRWSDLASMHDLDGADRAARRDCRFPGLTRRPDGDAPPALALPEPCGRLQ